MSPLLLALCANIFFSVSSIYYAEYSQKISALWVNFYKAFLAMFGFFLVCSVFNLWTAIHWTPFLFLILSGISGLFIGDIFLLKGFSLLGSGRVLMIFGFEPLILGMASHFLFGQDMRWGQTTAILFLMACLFCFSLESFKSKGHWEIRGLLYALLGVILDSAGVLMTRQAFEMSPGISPFQVNFIRSTTTVCSFLILSLIPWFQFSLLKPWKEQDSKSRRELTLSGLGGAFFSLSFYLFAIQKGHLASISAIAGTSPILTTAIEVLRGHRPMTRYLFAALVFFVCGFLILILN